MRIVVDTNIFIAAAITPTGNPGRVLNACLGDITLVLSGPLLQEIKQALYKPQVRALHGWSNSEINRFVKLWISVSEFVPATTSVQVSSDPDDDKLFACAIEGRADYIVSGDQKHVLVIKEYQGVKTISPADFVRKILEVESAA